MKRYISPGSWFAFDYPDGWHEFQDSEEDSFLFYNPDVWTGNFRISASLDASPDFARHTMREELESYPDARTLTIGSREFVYSTETYREEGADYTSHFWVTGDRNMAVYATFTTAKGGDTAEAVRLLETLRLLNPMKPKCSELIPVRLLEVALVNEAYEQLQKTVKQELKKDFSAATAAVSIGHLQQLLESGKLKSCAATWEKVGRVLGCFLVDEMDGVEWVTLVDGHNELPVLLFGAKLGGAQPALSLAEASARMVAPVKLLTQCMAGAAGGKLTAVYEQLCNHSY